MPFHLSLIHPLFLSQYLLYQLHQVVCETLSQTCRQHLHDHTEQQHELAVARPVSLTQEYIMRALTHTVLSIMFLSDSKLTDRSSRSRINSIFGNQLFNHITPSMLSSNVDRMDSLLQTNIIPTYHIAFFSAVI